jgi:archaellum biogenesis protein FlaJ (TadC family)
MARFSLIRVRVRERVRASRRDQRTMFRTIAAAAIVFAFAAFALRHSTLAGSLEEPVLLLLMGTLFLIAGKVFSASEKKVPAQPAAARLVQRRV